MRSKIRDLGHRDGGKQEQSLTGEEYKKIDFDCKVSNRSLGSNFGFNLYLILKNNARSFHATQKFCYRYKCIAP